MKISKISYPFNVNKTNKLNRLTIVQYTTHFTSTNIMPNLITKGIINNKLLNIKVLLNIYINTR